MDNTMTEEQQKNMAVAQQINRATRADSASPYAGKYIGVLHQKVIVVSDSLDELSHQLAATGDMSDMIWIEASADYDQIYHIWELY